jgi:hypothetical protein
VNELVVSPSKKVKTINNNMIQNAIPLFLIFITLRNIPNLSKTISSLIKKDESGRIQLISISPDKIEKGISIAKKVGPYLPEPMIAILNNTIPIIEKLNKILALANLVMNNKSFDPIVPTTSSNSTNRIADIITSIEDEIPQENYNKIKPLIDIIVNFDKYKPLVETIANIFNPSESGADKNQLDKIIDAIIPLIGEKDENSAKKIKEMLQMVEMLRLLSAEDKNEKATD